MTDDLPDWLRAQLDEDERIARAASGATVVGEPGAWQPSPFGDEWEASRSDDGDEELLVALRPDLPRPPDVMSGCWGAVFSHRPDDAEPDADSPMPSFEHAAEHDPARVLREIDAKRRLIESVTRRYEATKASSTATTLSASWAVLADTLRLLALPYSDRPGYRDDWRP